MTLHELAEWVQLHDPEVAYHRWLALVSAMRQKKAA